MVNLLYGLRVFLSAERSPCWLIAFCNCCKLRSSCGPQLRMQLEHGHPFERRLILVDSSRPAPRS
jgi:hypothetical protein